MILRDRATDPSAKGRSFKLLMKAAFLCHLGSLGDHFEQIWLWGEWSSSIPSGRCSLKCGKHTLCRQFGRWPVVDIQEDDKGGAQLLESGTRFGGGSIVHGR